MCKLNFLRNGDQFSDNKEIRPKVDIDADENGNIIEFTGSQQKWSKLSEMIQETGSETEEEPRIMDELSKIKVIIEKQKAEIKNLNENLEIAKSETKKNELFSNFLFIAVKVFQSRNI